MSGRVAAVIPARLGSTRLPRKPLLRETGKFLIQHVHERVALTRGLDRVVIATDSDEIAEAVRSFGGEAVLTDPAHPSGTDRVAEAARDLDCDLIVNVQGDEPEIDPADLAKVVAALRETPGEMATLAVPLADAATYANPNAVKVVCDATGRALCFSRSPLPWSDAALPAGALKHVGVYGYSRAVLLRFAALPPSPLEKIERLEQLRALHYGIKIRVLQAAREPIGIDTPEDYRRFVARSAPPRRTT